ncbi:MAG: cupredoxin domain-containing protein [bacterium]|nr:cupredoxin domain-containing protein [bacterium]
MKKVLIIVFGLIVIIGAVFFVRTKNKGSTTDTVTINKSTVIATPTKLTEEIISVTSDGFSPQTITVKSGTKATWVNKSGGFVTVNSDPHPTHQFYSPLNLGRFNNGSSVQLNFNKAGKYGYHNHLKPAQTGTVVVE